MKKIILLLLTVVPGILFAQNKNNYEFTGYLPSISAGQVYLVHLDDGGYRNVTDSATVVNGKYFLHGSTRSGKALLLNFDQKKLIQLPAGAAVVELLISPGTHSIIHIDQFKNVIFGDSLENEIYKKFNTDLLTYNGNGAIQLLEEKYKLAIVKKDESGAHNLQAKLARKEWEKRDKVYKDFIIKNKNASIALFALQLYAGPEDEMNASVAKNIKTLFDNLSDSIKKSEQGSVFGNRIETYIIFSRVAIGRIAPDFELPDTSGKLVSLHSFKGKYILLDFWASWCPPCRAENLNLVKAYKDYHDAGFDILSVSTDLQSQKKDWISAIHDDHMNVWKHVADLSNQYSKAKKLYGVTGIPQNFLIGPDGKILARSLHGEDLENKLAEIFKQTSR